MILVSPAEPAVLRAIGTSSPIPEKFGSDFYWATSEGVSVGIQRKEIRDLVNSMHNGLLGKEVAKMSSVDIRVLLIEGNWRWTTSGMSGAVNGWSKKQHRGLAFSMQSQGFWMLHVDNHEETIECVSQLHHYLDKGNHSSIFNRPKAKSQWGTVDSREWGTHLLQSFDGVAVGTAEAIYDHFEGVPLAWLVNTEQMMEVKGVGKKRAESLMKALPSVEDVIP